MKVVIVILLLIIVGFLGYNFNERRIEKQHQAILAVEREKEQSMRNLIDDLRAAQKAKIKQAILDRQIINGMTQYEVRQAKGNPYDKLSPGYITDEQRQAGIMEIWRYENRGDDTMKLKRVMFDLNGEVIYVSDGPN